jgi:hypothetical protein
MRPLSWSSSRSVLTSNAHAAAQESLTENRHKRTQTK